MIAEKKPKAVSWLDSPLQLEKVKAIYKETKTVNLTEQELHSIERLQACIKKNLDKVLVADLLVLASRKKLFALLKYDNYNLFKLALEQGNLLFIQKVFKYLTCSQKFVMLRHQEYASVKKFVCDCKGLSWDSDFEKIHLPILKEILQVEPNWELKEIIQQIFLDQSSPVNKNTIQKLNSYFDFTSNPDKNTTQKRDLKEELVTTIPVDLTNKKLKTDPAPNQDSKDEWVAATLKF